MTPLTIAHGVRRAAERYYRRSPKLTGYCGPCSFALMVCLKGLGRDASLVWGRYGGSAHFWVVSDGEILDVTASQFKRSRPCPVQVTTEADARYKSEAHIKEVQEATKCLHILSVAAGFDIAKMFSANLGSERIAT